MTWTYVPQPDVTYIIVLNKEAAENSDYWNKKKEEDILNKEIEKDLARGFSMGYIKALMKANLYPIKPSVPLIDSVEDIIHEEIKNTFTFDDGSQVNYITAKIEISDGKEKDL